MIPFLIILWLLIGAVGFWYFWTKDFDLTTKDLGLLFAYSTFGPIAWIALYFIEHPPKERTIFKQRTNNK